jgi:hypothetical protein
MKFCFDLGLAGIHTDFPKKAMALKESYLWKKKNY